MNKILYLTYDGLTDFLGQSQVLPYLVGLINKGYDISLISFEKKKAFDKGSERVMQTCKKYGIKWYPLSYTKNPPVLSTLRDLYKLNRLVTKLHKKESFSIIHCRSYITSLIGLRAKKKLGLKFIFDMRGLWADERIDGNLWSLKNPLYRIVYRFFKKKEKEFFTKADYIISLTHNAKEEIIRICKGQKIAPIEIIPCCVDLELFDYNKISPHKIQSLKTQLAIPLEVTVLSYIGSISDWYMLHEMLLFFKQWLKNDSKAIFLFITGGNASIIKNEADKIGLPQDQIKIVEGERDEMCSLIALGNYSVFFIKPLYSKKASSPTKQGEIMAMGKPIICNAAIGDTDYVIDNYKAGVIISKFTEEAFQYAIDKVKQTEFDPVSIRKGAEEFYSLEMGVNKYDKVYKGILNMAIITTVVSRFGTEVL